MVRCTETSHASLLSPMLSIIRAITTQADQRDLADYSPQMFKKLAFNLCKKVLLSSDALRRSNSGWSQQGEVS